MTHTNCTDAQLCVIYEGIYNKCVPTSTLVERGQKMMEFTFAQPVLPERKTDSSTRIH